MLYQTRSGLRGMIREVIVAWLLFKIMGFDSLVAPCRIISLDGQTDSGPQFAYKRNATSRANPC